MAIYDGVVTVADDDIPVIVELDDAHIRLSASGTEIGQWATDDCLITHVGDTTYSITAEDETLWFVPNQPSLFAAAVNGGVERSTSPPSDAGPESLPEEEIREAPAPRPLTMGLFYALCVATATLAIWSLLSMVF